MVSVLLGFGLLLRIFKGSALLAGEVFGFSTNLISVSLALKNQWLLTVTRNIKVEAFVPW